MTTTSFVFRKRWADCLTILRLLGALLLPLTWFFQGSAAVGGWGGWLFLALLVTDLFDGRLARQSGLAGTGFWSRADRPADLLLTLSSFTLLGLADIVTPLTYLLVAVLALGLYQIRPQLFQPPVTFFLTAFYFWVAWGQSETFGWGLLAFFLLHALFSRKRFGEQWRQFFGQFR
ncbi:MAG: hypothetical protein VE99_C0003G0062 [candidate division Kazan bacterium GW2011_GWC1_52_13]|nr:MAG: hypothetical protein VE99_C0003G0062 [candidate division Kazan bacterium GW2011_GWC1_52_13]